MKKLADWFGGLKLNHKLSLALFCIVAVPVLALAAVLFGNMRSVLIQDKIKAMEADLLGTRANVEKMVEMCSLTTQGFLDNDSLAEFLRGCAADRQPDTEALIHFYRSDVAGLERLLNANPYLYQVRVYQPNESIPEIMPMLYHKSRMQRLSWAAGNWGDGAWQLDYTDNLFDAEVMRPTQHIMAQVTTIRDASLGELGVLEVALRMEEVLPALFVPPDGVHSAMIAGDALYTWDGELFSAYGDEIAGLFDSPDVATVQTDLGGRPALVSSVALDALGGRYFSVVYLSELTGSLAARQNLFLLATVLLLLGLLAAVNLIVRAILRRFYRIVDTVAQVRGGNLSVTVPDVGRDEVGELGEQINQMLNRIQSLMQENVDRQLATKTAEIRALQSQINAHFIYNVLESIKMMAEVDGHYETADAITRLGRMLRYSMRWSDPGATLAAELENVENYLALMNLRYDYAISLKTELPPEFLAQELPKMTLQPLVENAVVHGIEPLARDTTIHITARRDGPDAFLLEVTDHGQGIAPEHVHMLQQDIAGGSAREGLGLRNVHDRVVTSYGAGYGLSLSSQAGAFTKISLRLPFIQ